MREIHGEDREGCICALVDVSIENDSGLEEINDLTICMDVIDRIARRRISVTAEHMLELIENSPFPNELLSELPAAYRCLRRLKRVALIVMKREFEYEPATLEEFGDAFWETMCRKKIAAGDYLESWTIARVAVRGVDAFANNVDPVFPADVEDYPVGLPCSKDTGRRMLQDLHAALQGAGFVRDVLELRHGQFMNWSNSTEWPAGMGFALALDPQCRKQASALCMQAIAVAAWANTVKKVDMARVA